MDDEKACTVGVNEQVSFRNKVKMEMEEVEGFQCVSHCCVASLAPSSSAASTPWSDKCWIAEPVFVAEWLVCALGCIPIGNTNTEKLFRHSDKQVGTETKRHAKEDMHAYFKVVIFFIVSRGGRAGISCLQEDALSYFPLSRAKSELFWTQGPIWPNSYYPPFFFNKSDFKCLAFQAGCTSALYSQTGAQQGQAKCHSM